MFKFNSSIKIGLIIKSTTHIPNGMLVAVYVVGKYFFTNPKMSKITRVYQFFIAGRGEGRLINR